MECETVNIIFIVTNLILLCKNILQPIRNHFNIPVSISSGYRSAALCEAIGSSSKSQHTKGQAADFEIFGVHNKELSDWKKLAGTT